MRCTKWKWVIILKNNCFNFVTSEFNKLKTMLLKLIELIVNFNPKKVLSLIMLRRIYHPPRKNCLKVDTVFVWIKIFHLMKRL